MRRTTGVSAALYDQRTITKAFRHLALDQIRGKCSTLIQTPMPRKYEQSNDLADPAQKYSRQPRHKTKASKYDYKAEEAKRNRTSTHRGKKRKRGNGFFDPSECFEALNVNTERVSLKPNTNLGIFSKSKMSVPLTGRDLPDLTFTNMEFLAKNSQENTMTTSKVEIPLPDNEETRTCSPRFDSFMFNGQGCHSTNTCSPIQNRNNDSSLLFMSWQISLNAANDSLKTSHMRHRGSEQRPL